MRVFEEFIFQSAQKWQMNVQWSILTYGRGELALEQVEAFETI